MAAPGQPPPAAALKGDFLCEASPGCAVIMRLPWKHTDLYDVCRDRNSSAPPTVVSCSSQSSWSRSQRLCLALSPPPVSLIHTEIQAHSDLRPLLIWGKTAAYVLPQARRASGPLRDTLLRLQSDSPESGGKLMMSLEQELSGGLSPPWTLESTRLPEPENWRI